MPYDGEKMNSQAERPIGCKLLSFACWSWIFPAICALGAMTLPAFGATYYVDFAGGNNAADGVAPESAWKHSPGDKSATDKPKAAKLAPGDTIVFKGGVAYQGEIQLNATGTEGNPITLDGNSEGKFGEGRAILDGARMITNWQRVGSAD